MKQIIEEMKTLFEENEFNYSDFGCKKIIQTWLENKGSLINLLSKHPNWNPEKYYIAFDTDWNREPDMDTIYSFKCYVKDRLREMGSLSSFPSYLFNYTEPRISENLSEELNVDFPELRIRSGMKTSKVMRQVLLSIGFSEKDKIGDSEEVKKQKRIFRQKYSDYSDAINPLKIKRHTVISVNPIDYLLSSNGNSWSSCHTIDRNHPDGYSGQNCSGTLSYMLDRSTIVFYQVDKEYDGNDLELEPKIIRQMFHYQNETLIQGRLYPKCHDGKNSLYVPTREIMQWIIASCEEKPNLWLRKKGTTACRETIFSIGTHYPDYVYNEECSVSRMISLKDKTLVSVGHLPICPSCGDEHNICGSLNCNECNGIYECAECGCEIDETDAVWIGGVAYCPDCVSTCECCGSLVPISSISYYGDLGADLCDRCVDEYYSVCSSCGCMIKNERSIVDINGNCYCEDCAQNDLIYINEEYYPNEEVKICANCGALFIGEGEYCEDCREECEVSEE